jgi:hypothetical protein
LTPTPLPKDRCPPSQAEKLAAPTPRPERRRPRGRCPLRRANHDSTCRARAVVFPIACNVPIRRLPPRTSAQSDSPASAVGTAARIPTPTRRSDASSVPSPPTRSRSRALVQVPTTISVSGGCNGWPNHVPLRASFGFDPAGISARTAR